MEVKTFLVEEAESHVVVLLLGFLFLLLLLGLGGGATGRSISSSGGGGGSAGARADVGEHLLDVDSLQSLGKKSGPERLDVDLGGLQDGLEFLGRDGDFVIGEDESGVGASEFGVGHFVEFCNSKIVSQVADFETDFNFCKDK